MILFKPITRRNGEIHVIKVDYEDSWLFLKYKYHIRKGSDWVNGKRVSNAGAPYCARSETVYDSCGKKIVKTFYIHHDVIGRINDHVTDHIDRDTLNNTRKNLRNVIASINSLNTYRKPISAMIAKTKKGGVYQVYHKRQYIGASKLLNMAIYIRDQYLKSIGETGEKILEEIYKEKQIQQ
jgi:hypothetical protein